VGDGDGGLLVREGECTSLRARRALLRSAASAGGSTSLLKQITR
jgi:brefeldin A-resistance guanine nucleotide exchange factor 1